MELPPPQMYAVEVDGRLVPRELHMDRDEAQNVVNWRNSAHGGDARRRVVGVYTEDQVRAFLAKQGL